MELKTYRASSMADALAEVKKDLGKDAVILHARTFKAGGVMGVGARTIVEITASNDPRAPGPKPRAASAPARVPAPALAPGVASIPAVARAYAQTAPAATREPGGPTAGVSLGSGHVARTPPTAGLRATGAPDDGQRESRVSESAPGFEPFVARPLIPDAARASAAPARVSAPLPPTPPAVAAVPATDARAPDQASLGTRVRVAPVDEAARQSLESELASIKSLVSEVLEVTRRGDARPAGAVQGAFAGVARMLERHGVSRGLIDEVVAGAERRVGRATLDAAACTIAARAELASLIPIAPSPTPPKRRAAGPCTIALIGPTGVGKTTTIAKLAAEYSLRAGLRVGLIAADTYRIAAVDQLKTYASIIDVPLVVASGAEQIPAALAELAACDVILLDTAGRSQRDSERLDELAATLQAASPDRTHLVLAGTGAESVVMEAVTRFGAMNPSSIIFTKLDEAVHVGMLVNVATASRLGIAFLTTGQDVPDNIEPAGGERLAAMMLDVAATGVGSTR